MKHTIQSYRRNFIKTAAMGTLASIGIPQIVSEALAGENTQRKITFNQDDVLLFQGDSITDWGRDHAHNEPDTTMALGSGYVIMVASKLLLNYASKNLQLYNKGIAGNKVYQLAERWENDCLAFKPDILSIHIGANDYWHAHLGGYKGTLETYITDYKKLLTRTKLALPGVKLIIGEPFAIKGVKAVDDSWYPAYNLFRKAARDIAAEFEAIFIPYQAAFDKAVEAAPPAYWTMDGIHPCVPGEALMAQTWLRSCGLDGK